MRGAHPAAHVIGVAEPSERARLGVGRAGFTSVVQSLFVLGQGPVVALAPHVHPAHDWFLRGRIRYREPGPKANAEANGMFDRALALDTGFGWALAIRSYVKFHAWFFKWNTAPDALAGAFADAERAAALDPGLAAVHSYLGWIARFMSAVAREW